MVPGAERDRQTRGNPDGDEDRGFAQHQAQDVAALRAERMRMPISLVRRDTLYDISPNRPIEARSRARPPKRAYACANSFSCAKRCSTCLDLRRHVHQRQVGIDLTHRLADARRDARWRRRRPHLEHGAAEPRLRARHVHRRRRVVTDAVDARVAQHADDLELIAVLDARSEAAPERALVREIRPRRGLVDDRDLRRRCCRRR